MNLIYGVFMKDEPKFCTEMREKIFGFNFWFAFYESEVTVMTAASKFGAEPPHFITRSPLLQSL